MDLSTAITLHRESTPPCNKDQETENLLALFYSSQCDSSSVAPLLKPTRQPPVYTARIGGHSRCRAEGCPKQPTYNFSGVRGAIFCAGHARDGMVDVRNKRCKYPGCHKQPSRGVLGAPSQYCRGHAPADMVVSRNRSRK